MTYEIAALYKFARLPQFQELRAPLQALCERHGIKGSLLIAHEGINGTIAGKASALRAALAEIETVTGIGEIEVKFSFSPDMPFLRMKVKPKAEIVTIGDASVDPLEKVGIYVEPEDWNDLISDPEVLVIDTRNSFEVAVGSFKGAIDPETTSFGEFPAYVRSQLDPAKHKKIAMFCTGGIRCEKASSFMLNEGFEEVYHLKGGILKYLERVEPEDSLWEGGCFVFDSRVAVGHGLAISDFETCHGCRRPLRAEEIGAPGHEEGVSCPSCVGSLSETQKASARERHRQMKLALARGTTHLGPQR
ncbi:rhodanese-related sulfurtransferase [Lacibacterium aquatile]|uniref:tRNA uridine(34) hydroxylase n=1 Tax=Lacibacterium aquatile TaxID=1168082 RepID=A0ABW5DVQ7_9PROT